MTQIFKAALTALLIIGPVSSVFADTAGSFIGASDHITTGGVTITKNADGTSTITFDSSFSLDGAPDPHVGFGKDGKYDLTTWLGLLKSKTGAQSYIVPASVDIDDFNELYIWCLKFGVPLGLAELS